MITGCAIVGEEGPLRVRAAGCCSLAGAREAQDVGEERGLTAMHALMTLLTAAVTVIFMIDVELDFCTS